MIIGETEYLKEFFFHKITHSIAYFNFENNRMFEKFSYLFLKIFAQSNYLKQKMINIANGAYD